METIKQWGLTVSTTLVASAIFFYLCPSGKMEKMASFVIRLFLILALVSPFATGRIRLDIPGISSVGLNMANSNNGSYISEEIEDTLLQTVKERIEYTLEQEIRKKGINTEKIYISMDRDETGCISISKVEINLFPDNRAREPELQKIVLDNTGIRADVYYLQE